MVRLGCSALAASEPFLVLATMENRAGPRPGLDLLFPFHAFYSERRRTVVRIVSVMPGSPAEEPERAPGAGERSLA